MFYRKGVIVIDEPRDWGGAFNQRWGPSAHLLSDLPGELGTQELLAFAAVLGIPAAALQHRGTYREHIDIAGPWLESARRHGATVVDAHQLVEILRAKRASVASRGG